MAPKKRAPRPNSGRPNSTRPNSTRPGPRRPGPATVARTAWIVTAIVAVVVAATAFVGPPESVVREHPELAEPVVRSTSVCPYIGGESRGSSRIGVLALAGVDEPEPATDGDDEPVIVQRLAGTDDDPDPLLTVEERGVASVKSVGGNEPSAYAVRSVGALAPGIVAEQYARAEGPDVRGIVSAPCTVPGRDHWFVGASAVDGQRGRLVISNPSSTPAVVTVSLWSEDGPVDAPGTKDVTIPARSQEILLLDAFVGDAEQLGVRVRSSQGRVSVAVEYRETEDGEPRGVTMIPAAAAPSTSIVVPGVPGHGERSLRIFAPGDTDAIVTVRVLGADGPFSPLGHDVITVPAGTVIDLPIGESVGADAAGIALDSDEEITAALRVVSADDEGLPDIAYTAARPPLPTGPAAVVLSRDDSAISARLLLTSVSDTAGRVTVTTLDDEGEPLEEQVVDVNPWSTAVVEIESSEDTAWATAVVEIGSGGGVSVVRELYGEDDDGMLLDLMPLAAPELNVRVPRVVNELPTGLAPTSRPEQQE